MRRFVIFLSVVAAMMLVFPMTLSAQSKVTVKGKVVDIKRNKVSNKYDIYIAHGEYITSYANLSAVSVAKGAVVKRGQNIGTIGSAVNISTMEMEYKIVFGIYAPSPDIVMSAANCFKK